MKEREKIETGKSVWVRGGRQLKSSFTGIFSFMSNCIEWRLADETLRQGPILQNIFAIKIWDNPGADVINKF